MPELEAVGDKKIISMCEGVRGYHGVGKIK